MSVSPNRPFAPTGGAIALFLVFLTAANLLPKTTAVFPPFERPALEPYAVQDMTAVLTGARRFGADLAFIQMLVYYGTVENSHPDHAGETEEEHRGHVHVPHEETAADITLAPLPDYPNLKTLGLRVGILDPFFRYAFLFTGGALGFNLNRTQEALDVLRRGAEADPHYPRYALYAGALNYRYARGHDEVVPWLEEAIKDPDCPTMVKNILANIYRRQGNNRRAAEIFLDMMENSRDPEYVDLARRKLEEMKLFPVLSR